jgi:Family of unknown function (DUF6282)
MSSQPFHPLLEGAFDIHVHTAPSIFNRKQTDWELSEEVIQSGMGGVVLKSHESSTVERGFLLSERIRGHSFFGGVVLNQHIGGWNPLAVETALKMGGKFVWCPTLSSKQHIHYFSNKSTKLFNGNPLLETRPLTLRDEQGQVYKEIEIILELINEYNAVLATGHLSLEDQYDIVHLALEKGIEKIVIQHADMGISKIPFEDQQYFAKKGCVIEKCYLACSSDFNDLTVKQMAESIQILGADACVLCTDFGQPHHITPVQALNQFVIELLSNGVTEDAITKMIYDNPRWLLGVE